MFTIFNQAIGLQKLKQAALVFSCGLLSTTFGFGQNTQFPNSTPPTQTTLRPTFPPANIVTKNVFGPGGSFVNTGSNQTECLPTGISTTYSFLPACPNSATQVLKSSSIKFSVVGNVDLLSSTGTTVTIRPKQDVAQRYNKGRIYAEYACYYDSLVTVVVTCNGQTCTNVVPVGLVKTGKAYIDVYQIFTWTNTIVGPVCVDNGNQVTYSIADKVSGRAVGDDIGLDNYYWRFPQGWHFDYNSADNSSFTATATTVSATDSIAVMIGRCNTHETKLALRKPIVPAFPIKSICASTNPLTVPLVPLTGITYTWNILADGKGHTYAVGSNSTQGPIKVNLMGAGDAFITVKSVSVASGSCPAGSRLDTINIIRPFTVANNVITGSTCLKAGDTLVYSVSNATKVNWLFPAGVTIISTPINAATVKVKVTGSYAGGGVISASNGATVCPGGIGQVVLTNLILMPPTPEFLNGDLCFTPGVLAHYVVRNRAPKYVWFFPAGFSPATVSDGNAVFVTPGATGGVVKVIAQPLTGSCVAKDTLKFTVNPKITPVVSNNGPVCIGLPVSLSANTVAGATYAWTGPSGFTSSLQNPVVNPVVAGVYSLVITKNGCTGPSASTTVGVISGVPITITRTVEAGGEVLAAAIGFSNYAWTKSCTISGSSPTVISTTRLLDLSGGLAGETCTYTVTAKKTGGNGCLSTASASSIYKNARVATAEEAKVSIYPNPSNDEITLSIAPDLIGTAFEIINTAGVVMSKGVFTASPNTISIAALSSGQYVIKYVANAKVETMSFQVVH